MWIHNRSGKKNSEKNDYQGLFNKWKKKWDDENQRCKNFQELDVLNFADFFEEILEEVNNKKSRNKKNNDKYKRIYIILLIIFILVILIYTLMIIIKPCSIFYNLSFWGIYTGYIVLFIFISLSLIALTKWIDFKKYQETWSRHSYHHYLLEQEMMYYLYEIGNYSQENNFIKRKKLFLTRVMEIERINIEKFVYNLDNKEIRLGEDNITLLKIKEFLEKIS